MPETDPAKLAAPAAAAIPRHDDNSFILGAEDIIIVNVWGDQRLSGEFLVRPDGYISMSLIGEVEVAGKTPEQLSGSIKQILQSREILKNPSINTQVKQINSKKYYLQGEVNKTGSFSLAVPTTVLEALVNAGGFRDFAKTRKIVILRGLERHYFNYNDAIKGKHPEQNIALKNGDIIIVP